MYNLNKWVFTGIILVKTLFAQSILKSDTLYLLHSDSIYFLKDPFILSKTFNAYIDGKMVEPDSLDPIQGIVYWKNQLDIKTKAVLSYKSLDTELPITIGPKWKNLPVLDSLAWHHQNDIFTDGKLIKQNEESDIFASGTIHRQLNLSPFGGSSFSGGMRIQLNGRLNDDILVSGILSDQDLPIQPEGITRNLEELQQVYLTIQHPEFNINAGDIDFNYTQDNFININRKLIGLNNTFKYKTWGGTTVYATTRGRYRSIEFKGLDGNQGPYSLTSESNSRDIIILAGSENIWVDGKRMIRGENYDYTIDYSLGEITFTLNQLIYADADIFIEYQYINFQYSRNMFGGAFEKRISTNGKITAGIFREKDQINKELFDTSTLNSLSITGNKPVKRSGAIRDDSGDYYLKIISPNDSLYVYDPEKDFINERYLVSFFYNSEGEYQRKISSNGKIYYEYMPEIDRSTHLDLYSPFQIIIAPSVHDLLFADGEWYIGDNLVMKFTLAGSDVDNNSLSNKDDEMNSGLSYRLNVAADSIQSGSLQIGFSAEDLYKQDNYQPLGWDKSIRYRRFWNLDTVSFNEERQTKLSLNINLENLSSTKVELAQMKMFDQTRNRTKLTHSFEHPFFRKSSVEHYRVASNHGLYSFTKGLMNLNTGSINPFVKFEMETDPNFKKYGIIGGGINFQNKTITWNSGIQLRDESIANVSGGESWVHDSEDITGYINYSLKSQDGWRNKIVIKHRLKTMSDQSSRLNYILGRLHLFFRMPTHPVNWELKFESEETSTQQRSIVYDSVGVGLGQYRYDANFNTYVSDPNGAFIAYTIPTGKRNPTTVLEGLHRFIFDFGKLKGFPDLQLRSETRLDFRGSIIKPDVIFNPSLIDSSVVRSRWNTRTEVDWKSQKVFQHIRSWVQVSRDLQGLDPRGNDLNQLFESGFEFIGKRHGILQLRANSLYRTYDTKSMFSNMRDRNISGSWNELHLIIKANRDIELDTGAKYGHDIGKYQEKSFDVTGFGIELNGQLFIGVSGRLQLQTEWNSVSENEGLNILPPEALYGLPVGDNLKSQTRFQYLFNQNISLVLSLNTIHNQRYKNLVTFLGEFRAYF